MKKIEFRIEVNDASVRKAFEKMNKPIVRNPTNKIKKVIDNPNLTKIIKALSGLRL